MPSRMWGSYLVHALPEQRVFIDSRQDFYGEALLREFDAVTGLRTNWSAVLDKYDVRWTLMPTDHRLNIALALQSNLWQRAYRDDIATIFVRNGSGTASRSAALAETPAEPQAVPLRGTTP
jgi:hypothetical protein